MTQFPFKVAEGGLETASKSTGKKPEGTTIITDPLGSFSFSGVLSEVTSTAKILLPPKAQTTLKLLRNSY
jgi:hypothetical protein